MSEGSRARRGDTKNNKKITCMSEGSRASRGEAAPRRECAPMTNAI